ncbi:MAG: RNA 2',3'-cyclic phosphodiesterase [Deltaproteobacteria bacterium]|nr:RNA 2',3'-cyclic phosphodiesterase [Deltaproteobacteria bacterium]
MSAIRCFLAADLPEEVKGDLARLRLRLASRRVDLRWVAPGSMHLTLKFLGELSPETFDAVATALDPPLDTGGPLRLAPRGLSAFPTPRRARVLWVGLEGDVAALARVALTLEARAEAAGVPREARPFRPHLTLGRAKSPGGAPGLADALAAEEGYAGPAFSISEIVLYESRLRPEGTLYIPRKTLPLT